MRHLIIIVVHYRASGPYGRTSVGAQTFRSKPEVLAPFCYQFCVCPLFTQLRAIRSHGSLGQHENLFANQIGANIMA